MLDIAEKCFARIAKEIQDRGLTVAGAFEKYVQLEEVEGEALALMSPVSFLEGIRELGIEDLEEIEVACLMRVLAKPNMDSAILLTELIVIMENFGIGDEEIDEDDAPSEMEPGQTPGNPDESTSKSKKTKKGIDLSQMDEKSVKIMAKLMLAMMELNMSLYEFFEGCIFEQLVKSKTKEDVIEIMKAESFFNRLQERGVRKKNTSHDNLQNFLRLDANFPDLLTIRKIAKTLDEMAQNEELMEGILAAVDEADAAGGGEEIMDVDEQRDGGIQQ